VLRRVLREYRLPILVLLLAFVVNVGVYAGIVYPLASKVADADSRAARADRALREARREFDAARGVATSQQRAEAELKTFYGKVLPADLSAAQRVTYLTLAQLARTSNLRIVRRTADEGHNRGSRLDYLKVALFLEGQYEDVRAFVHAIEISHDFVIIDDVELDQARDGQTALMLKIQLSTYYQGSTDGS
jgi:Tfp pilus assembly protein PilO